MPKSRAFRFPEMAGSFLAEAVAEIERETFTAPPARKYLSKLLAIATGEEMTSYSIESWTEEWLRRKKRDSSKATMARYDGHTEALLSWLGTDRRKKPLESLTALDARRWRESLQDGGRAGKVMLSAGVDRGKPSRILEQGQKKGAGRITYERGFHSLRHTFTSWLRNLRLSVPLMRESHGSRFFHWSMNIAGGQEMRAHRARHTCHGRKLRQVSGPRSARGATTFQSIQRNMLRVLALHGERSGKVRAGNSKLMVF